jgi:peptide/nickel transport system ATP-binding protein
MSETAKLVELNEVSIARTARADPVLDRFSLSIAEGETVVLLGERLSGKDSILRLIERTLARENEVTGTIVYRGQPEKIVRSGKRPIRIAHLPSPSARPLSPDARVASQLVRVIARNLSVPRASARAELKAALARLAGAGAPPYEAFEKKPGEIDTVSLAWALLATAMAQTPDLVLADHATGDLGPTPARALTLALVAEQKRLKFALLYAANQINVAGWLDGRIVVMRAGRVVEEGSFERLASPSAAHSYTMTMFRTVSKLSGEKPLRTIARGEALLRVQGLDLTASAPKDERRAMREGITFELRRGAALALVGEEGSGRRALARAVLGLDRPPVGRVVLDAVDLSVLSETMIARLRRRMTFITGADDALDPRMTLWDTVDEPLRAHLKLSRDLVAGHREAALKRVGLASFDGSTPVSALPAFDKRRLQVARAIVSAPLLAVIDEPLRGLDAFAQALLRELLTDFRSQEGPAFLVITSDFSVAQALADEAMVLKDRHVIERGPIHEILRAPKEAETRALIDAVAPPKPAPLPKAEAEG